MPLRHQLPRRLRHQLPRKMRQTVQERFSVSKWEYRFETRDRTSRSPRAARPQSKGSRASGQRGGQFLDVWIDLPTETEQLRARRRGGYQGPNRLGFLGEFIPGRQSLLRSRRGIRFRDDAEGLDVVLIQRAGASDFRSSDVRQCAGNRKRVSSPLGLSSFDGSGALHLLRHEATAAEYASIIISAQISASADLYDLAWGETASALREAIK